MKAIVLVFLAAIVISLFSGLFFLTKNENNSTKVLKALKIRVGLSILLVVFLVAAYSFGWLNP
jgi:hypothetical protein